MSAAQENRARVSALGSGDQGDRLSFRLVWSILFRCLPMLKPVTRHLIWLVVGWVVLALIGAAMALPLMEVFFSRILAGEPLRPFHALMLSLDPAIVTNKELFTEAVRLQTLQHLGIFVGIALVPVGLLFASLRYYEVWILQQVNQNLRLQLMERLQALSMRFHGKHQVGDAVYRLYQDSSMVTQLIDALILKPLQAGGRLLFSLAVVALFDPRLAMYLGLAVPLLLIPGLRHSRPMRVGFRKAREANSFLTSRIQEAVAGIRVIKACNAVDREQERFEEASLGAFQEAAAVRKRFAWFKVMAFFIFGVAMLLGILLAAQLAAGQEALFAKRLLLAFGFTTWNLGVYENFRDRMSQGAVAGRTLMAYWGILQDMAIGLDRVFELLDHEPEVQDEPDAGDPPPLRSSIAFEKVSFAYQPDQPVLQQVSLHATTGSVTAIVGPTGSGKSTLMALLLRLYNWDNGVIRMDGKDIRRYRTSGLRRQISIALQENILFGTSVRENIRYGRPDASDAEVREAARVACADEFIAALPEGYDTMLGERGTRLSTGQRQRLSIARAVLKDAPVLILDEPTAALDAETELQVLQRLAVWGRDRVIFLITHRLSTIRRADHIAFMQKGILLEYGSHEELIAGGGHYHRLVREEKTGHTGVLS